MVVELFGIDRFSNLIRWLANVLPCALFAEFNKTGLYDYFMGIKSRIIYVGGSYYVTP